ncbi:hypothetical protein BLS_009218 [Venturia inaequalis]|uniref:Uncharacterized protein n=1 Tax=Venturia inaequalis TaxID=5025 RepID=A0A8H3YMZ3_VENIN|nr:hypothetical protein BLS_009218 [Venturia inaequalis]KAE9966057.1 hypothetical protein EG328_009203 [Venturia inaequalis]KAE9974710.1 hypothetical protein EG327_008697 [Venturia inaequalis]
MAFISELGAAIAFGAVLLMWSAVSAPAPALVPECLVLDTPPAEEAPSDTCDCQAMQSTIDRQWARIDRLQTENTSWAYKAMEFDNKIAKLRSAPRNVPFCNRCDFRQHRVPSCDKCGDLSRKLAASERRCESVFAANDILRSENSEYYRFFGKHSAQLKEQEHNAWVARFLGQNQQELIHPAFQHPINMQMSPPAQQFLVQQPPFTAAPPQFFPAYLQTPAHLVQNAPAIQPPPIQAAPPQAAPVAPIPPATPSSKAPAPTSLPKAIAPSQTAPAPPKTPAAAPPKPPATPASQKTLPDFDPGKISIKFPKRVPNVPVKLVINPPGTRSATAHNATPPPPSSTPTILKASGTAAGHGIGGSGKPSAAKAMMDRMVALGLAKRD